MTNPTPAQVAALAALFGITPETHRHLRLAHNRMYDDRYQQYLDPEKLPDPLGPDADGVWLVPMMRWAQRNALCPTIYGKSQIGEHNEHAQKFFASVQPYLSKPDKALGDTMTAPLLQACLAARVPEVCRAMGVEG